MKVLVFDTETTGLPTERNPSVNDVEKWPYIIQLSFILYDTETIDIIVCKDHIIRLDDSVYISPESIKVHGITRSQSMRKGIPLMEALNDFNNALKQADWVVGHNISFDKRMIMAESNRLKIPQHFTYEHGKGKKEFCTMTNAVKMCKIEAISRTGRSYYKYPKLHEVHEYLFQTTPTGLHDSMGDVLVCMRCYGIMIHKHDIAKNGSTKLRNLYKRYCEH
jgi:DNA polymerase III epsilon subunit-like protein